MGEPQGKFMKIKVFQCNEEYFSVTRNRMPEDVRRFPLGPGLNLVNYHLSFVFHFSFPLESLLLKGYCDERYTRRSWGPRLIAETSGKS